MPDISYQQFQSLMAGRRYADAAALAESQVMNSSGRPDFWLTQQARALLRAGKTKAALEIANRAVAAAPSNPWALLGRADVLLKAANYNEALAEFGSLTSNAQVGARAAEGAMQCLERMGRWEELLVRCSSNISDSFKTARYRAQASGGLGRIQEAIDICSAALRDSPDSPQLLWLLTDLQVQQEGIESVLGRMGRLARIPNRPSIYREIYASLCRKAGKTESAIDQYEKIAVTGDPRILRKQAFALAKSGREQDAIPMLEELLRSDPADSFVHSSYGAACRRANMLERADRFYQELIGRFPDQKGLFGRLRKIRKEMPQS